MNKAKINNIEILFPAAWDNFNKKQLLFFVELYLQDISTIEIKTRLLLFLLNIKFKSKQSISKYGEELFHVKQKDAGELLISDREFSFLSTGLDFLFRKQKGTEYVCSELTQNLIPEFKINSIWFYGPEQKLYNLVWDEYMQADSYFTAFNNSKDEKDLDKLIASLYRIEKKDYDPEDENFDGDKREKFNSYLIEKRAALLSKLDRKIKYAIYLYYCGCKNYLKKTFDLVFNSSGSESSGSDRGYLTLNDSLSKEYADSPEKVRSYLLYDVMERLQNSRKAQIDLEKKIKK